MIDTVIHNKGDVKSILEACKKGDAAAFELLYHQYGKAMYHICLRMMGNKQDAEDVLQESFAKAFSKLEQYSGKGSFGAWMKRIVINRCLDELRKTDGLFLSLNENIPVQQEDLPLEEEPEYTVEDVQIALNKLPNGFRVVLNLYLFEEHSHRDIAEQLGISEGTSKSQYNRGKKKLIELIRANKYTNGR